MVLIIFLYYNVYIMCTTIPYITITLFLPNLLTPVHFETPFTSSIKIENTVKEYNYFSKLQKYNAYSFSQHAFVKVYKFYVDTLS